MTFVCRFFALCIVSLAFVLIFAGFLLALLGLLFGRLDRPRDRSLATLLEAGLLHGFDHLSHFLHE